MLLINVLKGLKESKQLNFLKFNPFIRSINFNSKKIVKDSIFIAITGEKDDGHNYIKSALRNGAILIVIEKKEFAKILIKKKINFIYTSNTKFFLSKISSNFYKYQPSFISAITGTNGKTSVSYITNEIWNNCNVRSASLGTLGLITKKLKKKYELTTEDSLTIHKILLNLYKKKINNICIEASSHGLAQNRIDSIKLDLAAFTNISQDHFDYHKNLKDYFDSKMRLFLHILKKNGTALINSDLVETKKIERLCKMKKIKVFTYGYKAKDLKLLSFYREKSFQKVKLKYKNKIFNYNLPLFGEFQVYNSLCAIGIVLFSGIPLKKSIKAIEKIKQIPGRLELINIPKKLKDKKISIFVDYAHTPDALKKTLQTLKKNKNKKLSIVFGCGGDRDKKKRPMMGKIAKMFADKVYITDDNPRNESAKKIRKEIISKCPNAIEVPNRYLAIKRSLQNSEYGETLLISGKGHEDYQKIGKKILKFNDKKVILKILNKI